MNRHRLQLRKEAEEQTSSSSANSNKDQETEKEVEVEKKSGESDVDLEEMLEKSLDNNEPGQSYEKETDSNNVQKDVAETVENTEAKSNNKMETDLNNVQKDVAETKSNNKMETDLNNVQKELGETVEPSDENSVDNVDSNVQTDMDTDIQEDNAKDNKESEPTKQDAKNMQMDDTDTPQSKPKGTSAKDNRKLEEENMQTDETDKPKSTPKGTSAKDKRKLEEENMQTDMPRKQIVTHSSAKKSAQENVHKDMDMPRKTIVTRSSANKVASKLVHKAKIKVKGSWEYVNNERAEHAKITKCYLCGAQKDTLRALELHMRRKHKSYRNKRKYCPKKYLTCAGRNKHVMYHTIGYRFLSARIARKGSCLKVNLRSTGVCTPEKTYTCRKKDCDKHYGSTRARNYHERQHNVKPMYCDYHETPTSKKCNQEFYSKQHLQQHYQGLHGDGWNAKCGKTYAWLAQLTAHEKGCAACGKIKKEEKARKLVKRK